MLIVLLGSPLILGDEDVVRFETDFSENAVLGIDTDIYELKDHDVIEARLSKRVAHSVIIVMYHL